MIKEKLKYITSRSYYYLNTYQKSYIKSHKEYESDLVFFISNNKGEISFILFDELNNEVFSLNNPVSNTYTFKMKKGHKYLLLIKSNKAVGSYKIKEKVYIKKD